MSNKRDDDGFQPAKPSWLRRLGLPSRWRRKRLVATVLAAVLIYTFVHNIPTDLGTVDQRAGHALRPGHAVDGAAFGFAPARRGGGQQARPAAAGNKQQKQHEITYPDPSPPPPDLAEDELIYAIPGEEAHTFAGPIRYLHLAATLREANRAGGEMPRNRNILFAAASAQSVAALLPLACDMAGWKRNRVHFMLLGRTTLGVEDILALNGIEGKRCGAVFHDGRPDYAAWSTELRAETAVGGALSHAQKHMHPQAIVTDALDVEDAYFVRALQEKQRVLECPVISLPEGRSDDFAWLTRLDSGSLGAWHRPTVDVLVHAPTGSSGSLVRLIKSLVSADYAGLPVPRLTIDLPADVEPFLREFLAAVPWPPASTLPPGSPPPSSGGLRLRHRVAADRLTDETATARFVENFYPADPHNNHVLVLSAQTEVSPLWYQYAYYNLLEHRYAYWGMSSENLMGVALDVPDACMNGSRPFTSPTMASVADENLVPGEEWLDEDQSSSGALPATAPFLWQAPSSHAMLIFGDKWVEFHDYVQRRLRALYDKDSVIVPPDSKRAKTVSAERHPPWAEYMLELVRAMGWSTLFPARPAGADAPSFAIAHNDLDAPLPAEETAAETQPGGRPRRAGRADAHRALVGATRPLHAALPFAGDLPEIASLPLLAYDGVPLKSGEESEVAAAEYAEKLRREVGGCSAAVAEEVRKEGKGKRKGIVKELFCFREDGYEVEDEAAVVGKADDGSGAAKADEARTEAEAKVDTDAVAEGSGEASAEAVADPVVSGEPVEAATVGREKMAAAPHSP